jgi:hypothetical protein
MPRYHVTGIGAATGRMRRYISTAPGREEALRLADEAGTIVSELVEMAPERPSAIRVDAARRHGIVIDAGITDNELADLISLRTRHDTVAPAELMLTAIDYGVEVTRYSGERLLFERIFEHLSKPGREADLVAWFTYTVYRDLLGRPVDPPAKNPDDPLVRAIARRLAAIPAVIASIRQYRGADLLWFGRQLDRYGVKRRGGSRTTVAYRRAAALLRPFAQAEKSSARAPAMTAETIR